jgi:hypothetical protein
MFATLTSHLRAAPVPPTEQDVIQQLWQQLLGDATTAQERDEINDLFGSVAA